MKKMRRMIPALCMLLVSAIMLSTASYAWFTMSNEATASGMQIKAEADSSLVISNEPLTYNTGKGSVKFVSETINTLVPMTYGTYKADGEDVEGWVKPGNTAGINPSTGMMVEGDTWVSLGTSAAGSYIQESIYIASAGAAMTGKDIQITLGATATSAGQASNAYAAAIYFIGLRTEDNADVWDNSELLPVDEEPDHYVFLDTATDTTYGQRNTETITLETDIPSIVGVGEQDPAATTGIKIIIRFYVDGNLSSTTTERQQVGYQYAQATGKFYDTTLYYVATEYNYVETVDEEMDTDKTYYVYDEETGYTPTDDESFDEDTVYYERGEVTAATTAVPTPDMISGTTDVPDNWYTREAKYEDVEYKFVRTDDVPTTGSELFIKFESIPKA